MRMATTREFEIEFKGWLTVEAKNKDEAIREAEQEIAWSRCRFDIVQCRQIGTPHGKKTHGKC